MQTNTNFNINNRQISFSGQRLMPLVLKTRDKFIKSGGEFSDSFKAEDCFFTKINAEDSEFFKRFRKLWPLNTISRCVIEKFRRANNTEGSKSRQHYFMVESASKNTPPSKRVKALMNVFEGRDYFYVNLLEAASKANKTQDVIGAGRAAMHGLCRLAEKTGKDFIELSSLDNSSKWYSELGMKMTNNDSFILNSNDFRPFQQRIERYLNINRPNFLREGGE